MFRNFEAMPEGISHPHKYKPPIVRTVGELMEVLKTLPKDMPVGHSESDPFAAKAAVYALYGDNFITETCCLVIGDTEDFE